MSQIAIDTNIPLRLAEPGHPNHSLAADAIESLRSNNREAVIFPQIVYECWAVGTRSTAANGLGFSAAALDLLLDSFIARFRLIADDLGVYEQWRQLKKRYGVTGVNSHDMRIVAAMIRHDVPSLLTFNSRDFTRYAEIEVLNPRQVVAAMKKDP